MLPLHRAFWREFTSVAIQQLNSLKDLCPGLTKPAEVCCLGHVKERKAAIKSSKLLCHLIEDLLHKFTSPLWPPLPHGLWSTTWARGSWAHTLSVGAPSGGTKEGVHESHTGALYYLQPLSKCTLSWGWREAGACFFLCLPLCLWFSASLYLPHKMFVCLSLVGKIQHADKHLRSSGGIWIK